ncbi:hypothetical protein [Rhodococcus sp. X156]|uniref:hypothetical protein n=1 Tax=Rhodococcus sp. X156 TaxID=2499145 RepID=UPI000FD6D0C2|nr:hypothetical protein [Rhodococcus sp. X156]
MLYLAAIIVLVALTALCWKAFGPQQPARPTRSRTTRVVGPDDDPDFLRRLDPGSNGRRGNGETDSIPPPD